MPVMRNAVPEGAPPDPVTYTFKYIGNAPARPDGTLMYRVPQVHFEVTHQREASFEIVDDGSPEKKFVLKCIRGQREYDIPTGTQIKAYEEIV